ncbi:MAG: M48 family metallopeptidase [Acidobacteriota bacterium]|nr:M48 family metallopeptidase [Acidobacteriota bacterium]
MAEAAIQHHDPEAARRYNRIRRELGIADFLLGVGMFLALLVTGWTGNLRDLAYFAARQNYTIAVFFYVVQLMLLNKLLGVGLDYYGFRLEHEYHLSNQKLKSWAWDELKGWVVGLVLATVVVELIYLTIRLAPQYWWLIAWAVFIVLVIFFTQVAPIAVFPLFYKFVPLADEDLKQRLLRLSERAGTKVRGVYEWKLSEKSRKANAALVGLGNTRRILLADTLLKDYTHDEIEAVLAHELGHHVHKHILQSILVQVGISLAGFWAANQALRYAIEQRGMFLSLSDFAGLPLLALVSTVMSFLLMPALNAYSRRKERQADRYSFQTIPSIGPFVSSMEKLCEQNLAEREPSRVVEWFFHSHPAISKRVAAAEAWATTHGQAPGAGA